MMKNGRFVIGVIAFALFSAGTVPISAGDSQRIDFDQGVDISDVVRDIQRRMHLSRIDKALLISPLNVRSAPDLSITGPVIGMDLLQRIHDSASYKEALEYPPLVEILEPAVRDPLLADWRDINTERAGLISEAERLEQEDKRLYDRAVELDRTAEDLTRRKEQLESEIDDFNRTCTGRPLPPDEYNACIRWQENLRRKIDQFNREADQYNNSVAQWREDAAELRRRAGTANKTSNAPAASWLGRVAAWEQQKVRPFSARAAQAVRDAKVSTIRIQAQGGGTMQAEPLTRPRAITLGEGKQTLAIVWARLTAREQNLRIAARDKALRFMENAAAGGGVGPTKQSFFDDPSRPDIRIDVEVLRGRAFVQDCCTK